MNPEEFWKATTILLKNFHSLNKKIFACNFDVSFKVKTISDDLYNAFIETENFNSYVNSLNSTGVTEECLHEDAIDDCLLKASSKYDGLVFLIKLLMKNGKEPIEGIVFLDLPKKTFTCRLFTDFFFDFKISFESGNFSVEPLNVFNEKSKSFCKYVLKPKLEKWSKSEDQKHVKSLNLIDSEAYNELYSQFKLKYSSNLMEIWPECTDPLKFIYEDLAIAAYLIVLWKTTESSPEAFADLGCGNGLLVYILSEEGYKGYGFDIRKRKIWDLYPKTTILFEQTISPTNFKLPEDVDWIIGNHSDELSAWIPALAAKHSYRMKYFLLPCCAYEFSGAKFQRRSANISIYNDFLDYVEGVSNSCGFKTLIDRLKIPSTKRIGLVGIKRHFLEVEFPEKCSNIEEFIVKETKDNGVKLRDKHEAVRNCTQINKNILEDIVLKIFHKLMENGEGPWNSGRELNLGDLVKTALTKADLQAIKSECGGLKTLLKNRHEIFIISGGNVKIRKPVPKTKEEMEGKTTKKRQCFFQQHHPNKCPLTDEICTFVHC
ncbi:TRMT44 family protein [Megaselia abdita]